MRRRGRPDLGMTLIEMVVAVAVMALAAAVAYPSLSAGIESARLRSAADAACSLVLRAQRFADRTDQVVLLRVDPEAGLIAATAEHGQAVGSVGLSGSLRVVAPGRLSEVTLHPRSDPPGFRLSLASPSGRRSGCRFDPARGALTRWHGEE